MNNKIIKNYLNEIDFFNFSFYVFEIVLKIERIQFFFNFLIEREEREGYSVKKIEVSRNFHFKLIIFRLFYVSKIV